MYIILLVILTIFSLLELSKIIEVNNNKYYIILSLSIGFILCFRFGQGTDYFAYLDQYSKTNPSASLFVNELYHGEIGWHILMVLSKRLDITFDIFIGVLSFIMIISVCKAIYHYSPYKITSLLILYPTFYLTYMFSGIRQGLVMSLFLGFGLKYILTKNYIKYYMLIIIMSFIHRSSIFLIIVPLSINIKMFFNEKYLVFILLLTIIIGNSAVLNIFFINSNISIYLNNSFSIMAFVLRLSLFLIIYYYYRNSYVLNKNIGIIYNIYLFGFSIYLLLSFAGTLSQRITMPLKSLEILLIPMIYDNFIRFKKVRQKLIKFGRIRISPLILIVIILLNVETIKNIYSYIDQGNYYSWVNPLNYPYISIFNKDKVNDYIFYLRINTII